LRNKINITYSVDLENLERETKRIYKHIINDLEKTIDSAPVVKDFLSIKSLNELSDLQMAVSSLSQRLHDLHSIVSGHIQYFVSPPPDSTSATDQLLEPLEQVKQKLQDLEALSDEVPT